MRDSPPVSPVSSVELITRYFEKMVDAHTVYETRGISPYSGWLRFVGLGLGYNIYISYIIDEFRQNIRSHSWGVFSFL